MKVFITGGTGNIGQYVTLAVANAGHDVVVLSRNPEKYAGLCVLSSRITLIQGMITDSAVLTDAVTGCDAVIHIALGWGDEPVSMLTNDTAATVNLLEIAENAGAGMFIYTSSTAAMGEMYDGIDETAATRPTDLYGATKSASEAYVLGFRQYGGSGRFVTMKRNVIRPGYTYSNPPYPGGSTEPDSRFRDIADAVVNSRSVNLTKYDGTQFISAAEIARLYLKLLESDKNEEIYLALAADFTSWEDIARIAIEEYPETSSKTVLNDLGYDAKPRLYCVEKIKRDFGLVLGCPSELREHVKWNLKHVKCK